MRPRYLVLLLTAALLLWPSLAQADEARELFDRAVAAREVGRLAESSELFHRSLTLSPRPSTAFNLAVTYVARGELRRAIAMLDKIEAGRYGTIRDRQQRDLVDLRKTTRRALAPLRIVVHGTSSAVIRLDGVVLKGSPVPHRSAKHRRVVATERVDPGEHVVVASAYEHGTVERVVKLGKGDAQVVHIIVEPIEDVRPGTLVLQSSDPDSDVEIVGVASGVGRLSRELPPGEYEVVVGQSRDRVLVPPGRRVRFVIDPEPGGAWQTPWPWLGLGGAVVAGAVLTGVLLGSMTADPQQNPEFPLVEVSARSFVGVPVVCW